MSAVTFTVKFPPNAPLSLMGGSEKFQQTITSVNSKQTNVRSLLNRKTWRRRVRNEGTVIAQPVINEERLKPQPIKNDQRQQRFVQNNIRGQIRTFPRSRDTRNTTARYQPQTLPLKPTTSRIPVQRFQLPPAPVNMYQRPPPQRNHTTTQSYQPPSVPVNTFQRPLPQRNQTDAERQRNNRLRMEMETQRRRVLQRNSRVAFQRNQQNIPARIPPVFSVTAPPIPRPRGGRF